jgi:hypothetical protein
MLPDGLVDKVKSGLSSVGISLDGIGQKFSEFGGTAVVDKIKALSKSITDMIPAGAADAVSQALKLIGLNLDALTEDLEQAGAGCLALIDNLGEIPKAAGKSFSAEAVKAGQNFGQAIVKLRTETMELKGSFDHLAPGFVSAAQGLGLVKTEADLTALAAGRLTSQQLLLNQELLKKAGAEAAQAALEPWERHNKQIEHYQMLAANGVISADTLSKAIQKSAETAGVAWNVATAEIAGNLSQGFGEFAKQNKKFAIAAKAAAIAQAVINTYTAATKALTLGPPLGWIAAAATIVAGLGYVAKIQSQEAFATGGSFRVAGGLTGVDSEMVAFSATPGEIVDVRRPGQTALSGGVQVVELKTPRVKDFFTENIRALVDSINAAAPDGYIIRMPAT